MYSRSMLELFHAKVSWKKQLIFKKLEGFKKK